jgi:hypothetical protein
MSEPKTDSHDLEAAWEKGKPVRLSRTRREPTSVLSIRVPQRVLVELTEIGRQQNKSVSAVGRELLESAVDAQGEAIPERLAEAFGRWVVEGTRLTECSVDWESVPKPGSSIAWVSRSAAFTSVSSCPATRHLDLWTRLVAKPTAQSLDRTAAATASPITKQGA